MAQPRQDRELFNEKITLLISRGASFRITFSKQRPENRNIRNAYLRTVLLKNTLHFSMTYRFKQRDEVKNYGAHEIQEVIHQLLDESFMNAVVFTETEEITLLQSKKNRATMITKSRETEKPMDLSHDKPRQHIVQRKVTWMQALGLAGVDGTILDKAQDKFRQINKYVEIVDHLLENVPADSLFTIADMGSGKGYLTFALYEHLTTRKNIRVKLTGYELREELVTLCYQVAAKSGFVGLSFQQKSIDQVDTTGVHMVIALHACDTATDMAIAKGVQAEAGYIVVSPCCHKQVRQNMDYKNALSPILRHGILEERMAEILTDGLRALIMEAHGYRTQVFEFISSEHTGKNLMITGVKGEPDPSALKKAKAIMEEFGIRRHALLEMLV